MYETNLTEIVNQTGSEIYLVVNGTINATTPVNIGVYGTLPPVQVPYIDLLFQLILIDTVMLGFVLVITFIILLKKGRVII